MKPYFSEGGIQIYNADCREVLPLLEKVDLVLTDPPYGIHYKPKRSLNKCKKWQSQKPFDRVIGDDQPFDPRFLLGYPRVILWGANHYSALLPNSSSWLVWDKKRQATVCQGFYSSDAELAWTNLGGIVRAFPHLWAGLCRDSETGGKGGGSENYHPTQKPVALMRWCLSLAQSSQLICDPFMGSGTTLVAAQQLGLKAIGIELEERYCEIAAERLRQQSLFTPEVLTASQPEQSPLF